MAGVTTMIHSHRQDPTANSTQSQLAVINLCITKSSRHRGHKTGKPTCFFKLLQQTDSKSKLQNLA